MILIRLLNANQLLEEFKELREKYKDVLFSRSKKKEEKAKALDFPGFHYLKWENIESFWRDDEWHAKARYYCAFENGVILGVNKVYVEPFEKLVDNDYRIRSGLKPIKGRRWGHAFVDVHVEFKRKGIAMKLFKAMVDDMSPGDVFSSRSYSDEGKPFVTSWANTVGANIILDDFMSDYDPERVNLMLHFDPRVKKVARRYVQAKSTAS